jgi:glucose uptake protein GlcU
MNFPLSVSALAIAVVVTACAVLIIRSHPKNRAWVHIAAGVAIIVISLPVTFWTTFLLLPFWNWIEAKYGIESVGHSGPSDWCFSLIFLIVISTLTGMYIYACRRIHET